MVTMSLLPSEIDVFVIGGGPAGLAAALAARQKGFGVIVADRASPAIDKACGEGLMPDGVAALRRLGVELGAHHGAVFRGIRFLDSDFQAEAAFPNAGNGLGITRTALHKIMVERAEDAGVKLCWQVQVEGLDPLGVKVNGQTVRCRWIIGADGFHSRVRQWGVLPPVWSGTPRFGMRQYFRIEPWTDFVEVYWNNRGQAYVTPVGPDRICVAMIGNEKKVSVLDPTGLLSRACETPPARRADRGGARRDDNVREIDDSRYQHHPKYAWLLISRRGW